MRIEYELVCVLRIHYSVNTYNMLNYCDLMNKLNTFKTISAGNLNSSKETFRYDCRK